MKPLIPCCSFPNRFLSCEGEGSGSKSHSFVQLSKGPAFFFFFVVFLFLVLCVIFFFFYFPLWFSCSILYATDALERRTTFSHLPATLPPCRPDRPPTLVSREVLPAPFSHYTGKTGTLYRTKQTGPRRDESKDTRRPGRPGDEPDLPRSPPTQSPLSPDALYRLYRLYGAIS